LLVCSSYSYSDTVYGSTSNAATNGYNWVMTNILPQQAGLTVGNVVYRYTTIKNTSDDMVVHVQNENALGEGYIFRSSDDWSGLPGNTINKVVPVNNIDISYWGNGSIQVDGFGTVEDASVIYTYQYDPCFDPQTDPACPGYIAPVDYSLEALVYEEDQRYIQDELDRKKTLLDEEEQEELDRRKTILAKKRRETDERLEVLLGFVNTDALSQEQLIRHGQLTAMNGLSSSYYTAIPGGTYQETIKLIDGKLPDAKKGLRVNLATQILHQKMVDLQYANSNNTTGEQ
jgi:hypothetical protein